MNERIEHEDGLDIFASNVSEIVNDLTKDIFLTIQSKVPTDLVVRQNEVFKNNIEKNHPRKRRKVGE